MFLTWKKEIRRERPGHLILTMPFDFQRISIFWFCHYKRYCQESRFYTWGKRGTEDELCKTSFRTLAGLHSSLWLILWRYSLGYLSHHQTWTFILKTCFPLEGPQLFKSFFFFFAGFTKWKQERWVQWGWWAILQYVFKDMKLAPRGRLVGAEFGFQGRHSRWEACCWGMASDWDLTLFLFPWCSKQDNLLEPAACFKGQILNLTKRGPTMIVTSSTLRVSEWSDPPGTCK